MKAKIYTVDYCPYCKKALQILRDNNVDFEQIRIDDDENAWRQKLGEMFNLKGEVTVPQIVIDEKYIGGCSDLVEKIKNNEIKFS